MVELPKVSLNTNLDEGLCFGCGRNNPIGLQLKFEREGKGCRAEFQPDDRYQGWPGILHGGITTCILDEAMSWAAYFAGESCLTASMEVRLRQPVKIDGKLIVSAAVTKQSRRLLEAEAKLELEDGTVVAEGTSKQFVVRHEPGHGGRRPEARS